MWVSRLLSRDRRSWIGKRDGVDLKSSDMNLGSQICGQIRAVLKVPVMRGVGHVHSMFSRMHAIVCVCVRFGNAAPSCQKPAEEANVLRHKTFHKTLSLLGG